MKKRIFPIVSFLFVVHLSYAQDIPSQYIDEAFANNLVLQQKKISLDKSLIALKEARSLFLPSTWLEGQYTLAKGGRAIEIPVGDLLNPVYQTLNQLTGTNNFPTIKNASEQLNPNNFYDVRIKTTMPLVNPDLRINRDIKQQQIELQQNEVDLYKRELLKEVKTAYFNFIVATKAIDIYQSALIVVNQNLKVNQSLLDNGKGLPAYVVRAESEVKQVETELLNANNQQQNAKAYFNFLLNKPLTDSIFISDTDIPSNILSIITTNENAGKREELKSLSIAKGINQDVLKMNQSFRKPKLNAFLDLASQGFDFKVNSNSFFYLGGLQLQVPIFSGKRNLYKIDQSQLDLKSIGLNTDNIKKQLELSTFVSRNAVSTAYNVYQSSLKQQESAQKYFNLIDRGYKEGVNSFIEFLDARNQLTGTELQLNINKYKLLVALTDYERQTASYSFK